MPVWLAVAVELGVRGAVTVALALPVAVPVALDDVDDVDVPVLVALCDPVWLGEGVWLGVWDEEGVPAKQIIGEYGGIMRKEW